MEQTVVLAKADIVPVMGDILNGLRYIQTLYHPCLMEGEFAQTVLQFLSK
jgi:hypothetical protein